MNTFLQHISFSSPRERNTARSFTRPVTLFWVLILGITFTTPLSAQKAKVTTGRLAYESRDLKKALDDFNIALGTPDQLEDRDRAKASYYRAKTKYDILLLARSDENFIAFTKEISMVGVYNDLENCKKWDENGRYAKKIEDLIPQVRQYLLYEGTGQLFVESYFELRAALLAAQKIKEDYVVYDLLGQLDMELSDYGSANENFVKGIELLEASPPGNPDLLASYMYYHLALILTYPSDDFDPPSNSDIQNSFGAIQNGKLFLDKEWARCETARGDYSADEWSQVEEQYNSAFYALYMMELELFKNFNTDSAITIAKFEEAIGLYPNDSKITLAFATYLGSRDVTRSIEMYNKVLKADPKNHIAYFNLGIIYFNNGEALMEQSTLEVDNNRSTELIDEALEEIRASKPYFEKALELEPNDQGTIAALKQICLQLQLEDEYKRYKEMEQALGN